MIIKESCTKTRSGALHLTQQVDYALFLLSTLAQVDGGRSVRSIATEYALSFSFLQKVAGILQRAGYIRAQRGKNGGYILARSAAKITFKGLIETLEGPIALVACAHKKDRCPRERFCLVRKGLQKMNAEIKATYMAKTLADFVSG